MGANSSRCRGAAQPKKNGWRANRSRPASRRSNCHDCPRRPEFKLPYASLRRKRSATTATASCRGILKNEASANQRLFVIERRIGQIEQALGIDKNARAIFLKHFIAIARLRFEAHRIRQPRAAAALHTQA